MLIPYFAEFPAKMNLRVRQGLQTNMTTKSFFLELPKNRDLSISSNLKRKSTDKNRAQGELNRPSEGKYFLRFIYHVWGKEDQHSQTAREKTAYCFQAQHFCPQMKWEYLPIHDGSKEQANNFASHRKHGVRKQIEVMPSVELGTARHDSL